MVTAGIQTLHPGQKVRLLGSSIPDIWYHVRKSVADMRHTLPAGVVGPGFNDKFGDVFGIIYGVTADGFTHRELCDQVEDIRLRLMQVPDCLEDRDPRRSGRKDYSSNFHAATRGSRD